MIKNERQREIINILKVDGFCTVNIMCEKLFASKASIRRDLTELESQGIVKRSYGGAELITSGSNVTSFSARAYNFADKKQVIAKKAATLISEGSVIFLDQSSTALFVAREIVEKKNITVVTNNLEIINTLSASKINVICSGGELSNANRACFVGTNACKTFESIYADILFFSTKSLTVDGVMSDCTQQEVFVRNSMLENSAIKVFLCNTEKIDTQSPYKQCSLKDVDYLITESNNLSRFDYFENLKIM